AEEIQETKSDLLTRIQTEREEIKRKIAENEKMIKEYNADFVELVRKGDFYSKSLFNSTQIFFTYQYLDNGKMKDR
ncbi:autotransporter-associated N-terminal domain-containing protein, partial [Fusobacterium ulcerans]|uniref:autotransporter-associated N-terminal domain-containing protein n=1 Tax=Fusobacterium ulcerans TaxID=861 RepID=UPI001D0B77C1